MMAMPRLERRLGGSSYSENSVINVFFEVASVRKVRLLDRKLKRALVAKNSPDGRRRGTMNRSRSAPQGL